MIESRRCANPRIRVLEIHWPDASVPRVASALDIRASASEKSRFSDLRETSTPAIPHIGKESPSDYSGEFYGRNIEEKPASAGRPASSGVSRSADCSVATAFTF